MKKFLAVLLLLLGVSTAQAQTDSYLALNGTFKNPFSLTNAWSALQTFNASIAVKDTLTINGATSGSVQLQADATNSFLHILSNNGIAISMSNANIPINFTAFSGYNALTFNSINTAAGGLGFFGGATGDNTLYGIVPTGGAFQWRANNAIIMNLNSNAGLTLGNPGTIAGTLGFAGTASGQFTMTAANSTATAVSIGGQVQVNTAGLVSSAASGTSGAISGSFSATQTQPNATDTSDSAFNLNYAISTSSAVNELVNRVLFFSATNGLTGGGHVQNMRLFDMVANSNAGAVTDNLAGLYFESGTNNGTTTNASAIQIASWPGTTKTTILDQSGGNWQNNGVLTLGSVGGVSGNLFLNGSTSGLGSIFVNTTGQIGLQASAGHTFVLAQGGTSAQLSLTGTTSGQFDFTVSNTGGHLALTSSSTPTNNACTGFALGTGSTDMAGRVTFTSATSCVINFGTAFTNAPFCNVTPGTAATPSTVDVTTSTTVLTANFTTAQTSLMYHCFGL